MALERCGAPFNLVRASSWEADSAIAQLELINPLKQIPTLMLPDGTFMSESAAILINLGLVFPDSGLLSADSGKRAHEFHGLVFIATNCYAAVSVSDFPERWCADPDESTVARVRQAARAQLHHHWEIFADTFPASPYLSGESPGALDFLAAVVSRWSGTRAHLKVARPRFVETLQEIEIHPDVASVFSRHWDA